MRRAVIVGTACFVLGAITAALAATGALRPDQFISMPWSWTATQTFDGSHKITGLPSPSSSSDASTKGYVDTQVGSGALAVGSASITGGTTGRVLYDNGGLLGEMTTSGSGTTLALAASPSISALTVTSSFTATGLVTLGAIATQSANTVVANVSGSTASPTAASLPSCTDTGGNHLNYTNATGFSCGTTGPASTATTLATGTSVSLSAPREYYVCTSTCTVTPPAPAAGYEFCVLNDNNVATVITLAALGSSARYENTARTAYGTAGTGTMISGAAVANKICILGLDSTHYLTTTYTGTWTAS